MPRVSSVAAVAVAGLVAGELVHQATRRSGRGGEAWPCGPGAGLEGRGGLGGHARIRAICRSVPCSEAEGRLAAISEAASASLPGLSQRCSGCDRHRRPDASRASAPDIDLRGIGVAAVLDKGIDGIGASRRCRLNQKQIVLVVLDNVGVAQVEVRSNTA
jgi:hypothetical protein